jgi:transcription elongation factor Elf1
MPEMIGKHKDASAVGQKDLYCPHCGRETRLVSIMPTMGGKIYTVHCQQHGLIELQLWEDLK